MGTVTHHHQRTNSKTRMSVTKIVVKIIAFNILIFPMLGNSAQGKPLGNTLIPDFSHAKKIAVKLFTDHKSTIYCSCNYEGKKIHLETCGYKIQSDASRAQRLEWEHVVPAEAFGQSFKEWREGAPECVRKSRKFKGRKCAEFNPSFRLMEGDLYNLWPEIGELNGLRSNYSMAALTGSDYDFGKCAVKLQDRKFEPQNAAKGLVARIYYYMDWAYSERGIISDKNRKLFEAWDKTYPISEWECQHAARVEKIQGNENPILKEKCKTKGWFKN